MGCFEDSALVNFPRAFWTNDLQGDGRNLRTGEGETKLTGLEATDMKEVGQQGKCRRWKRPSKPPSKEPPNLSSFKTIAGKAHIWGKALEGEGGKIHPPSLLHHSFLSLTSPICVYFASFCEADLKKNI